MCRNYLKILQKNEIKVNINILNYSINHENRKIYKAMKKK